VPGIILRDAERRHFVDFVSHTGGEQVASNGAKGLLGVSSVFVENRTDIAPRSSGEEDRDVKPFIGALRVTNPVRQSRASSRKRVLRGERRLSLRSVDSEIKRCAIEPRN
jgi:hypothetical protein